MRWWFSVAATVALSGCAHGVAPTHDETRRCTLTPQKKLANARLSFGEFDQSIDNPGTAASLSARGCHAAAAEVGQDYLARRDDLPERLRTSVLVHVARNLARAGRTDEAATAALGAVRDDGGSDPAFDWNAYVLGTWAFLKRDRALLEAKLVRLRSLHGHANVTNARVLDGLARCFTKPYAEAATPACQTP